MVICHFVIVFVLWFYAAVALVFVTAATDDVFCFYYVCYYSFGKIRSFRFTLHVLDN